MYLEFMTREVFDVMIFAVIIIGVILAFFRLKADFTRNLDNDEFTIQFEEPAPTDDDTKPHKTDIPLTKE